MRWSLTHVMKGAINAACFDCGMFLPGELETTKMRIQQFFCVIYSIIVASSEFDDRAFCLWIQTLHHDEIVSVMTAKTEKELKETFFVYLWSW